MKKVFYLLFALITTQLCVAQNEFQSIKITNTPVTVNDTASTELLVRYKTAGANKGKVVKSTWGYLRSVLGGSGGFVPYEGATEPVDLGGFDLTTEGNINAYAGVFTGSPGTQPFIKYQQSPTIFGNFFAEITDNRIWSMPDRSGEVSLLEDLDNYIPLAGTPDGVPITGLLELGNTIDNPVDLGFFRTNEFDREAGIKIDDEVSPILYKQSTDGLARLIVDTNIYISTTVPDGPGLQGVQEFVNDGSIRKQFAQNGRVNDAIDDAVYGLVPYTGGTSDVDINHKISASEFIVTGTNKGITFPALSSPQTITGGSNLNLNSGNGNMNFTAGGIFTFTAPSTFSTMNLGKLTISTLTGALINYNGTGAKNIVTSINGNTAGADGSISAGTVTSVSIATANGISGSVATATTTPAITLSLGAITPTSIGSATTVTTQSANDNSTKIASTAYADAKVADAINDGTTTIAPSQNVVFDNLALKAPINNASHTGTFTLPNGSLVITSGASTDVILGTGAATPAGPLVRAQTINGDTSTGTALSSGMVIPRAIWELQRLITLMPVYIVNSTTTVLSAASLNSTYPNVAPGSRISCRSITTGGVMYIKDTEAGSSDVWNMTPITVAP